jgi:hypothetical protein
MKVIRRWKITTSSIINNFGFSALTNVLKSDYFLHNVCPFVGMNTSANRWTNCPEILHCVGAGWGRVRFVEEFRENPNFVKIGKKNNSNFHYNLRTFNQRTFGCLLYHICRLQYAIKTGNISTIINTDLHCSFILFICWIIKGNKYAQYLISIAYF